jgi:beta-lactamase regulating signal transducer with metallopeptidase domain
LNGWLDRSGSTLLDATLASMALTGLVVLAMLQCRQPARRLVWARTGLISSLALLPLAALNPAPRVDLVGPIVSLLGYSSRSEKSRFEAGPATSIEQRATGLDLGGKAVTLYLLGVTVGLTWTGLGLWGVVRLVSRGSRPSPSTVQLYESLPFAGRTTRPQLLVSEKIDRPVLAGLLDPVILIPPDLDLPGSTDRLRLGLLHELAHVENLDHRFRPMALVAQAFWFFLPTSWWIREQLKLDQEFLADRRAVSHFGSSGAYASTLVEVASGVSNASQASKVSVIPSTITGPLIASALFQRVQMLVKCPFPIERETSRLWCWSTSVTVAIVAVATSFLTIRGLDDSWVPLPLLPGGKTQSIRIPQLVIAPRDSQNASFDLHYRLPSEFSLTLEVMAEPLELPLLEVLGHSLGRQTTSDSADSVDRLWHRVEIKRAGGFDFMVVDDRPMAPMVIPANPCPWISFRPFPSQITRIRDLELDWIE